MVRPTAGLTVSPRVALRRKRLLPQQGEVVVRQGAMVAMDDVVALASIPGPLVRVNAAAHLGITPSELKSMLCLAEGDAVSQGQLIARKHSPFNFLTRGVPSPASGVIESISFVTGYVMVREAPKQLELRAYLPGHVAEVIPQQGVIIEAEVSQIQGIFGLGRETQGVLRILSAKQNEALSISGITEEGPGVVVVCAGTVGLAALQQMLSCGVRAVVAASASGEELNQLVGGALNPASTGHEDIGMTIVLTEGFGQLRMALPTLELLRQLEGKKVSVSGTTQIRAGVIRPEIISSPCADEHWPICANRIEVGSEVRLARGRAFGATGYVVHIPPKPYPLDTGGSAFVVEIEIEGGARTIVPRANIEPVPYRRVDRTTTTA